jgi:hypothetical protein
VFGHELSFLGRGYRDLLRAHFATIGAHVTRIDLPGVQADLYDLTRLPDDPGRTSPALLRPGAQCLVVDSR